MLRASCTGLVKFESSFIRARSFISRTPSPDAPESPRRGRRRRRCPHRSSRPRDARPPRPPPPHTSPARHRSPARSDRHRGCPDGRPYARTLVARDEPRARGTPAVASEPPPLRASGRGLHASREQRRRPCHAVRAYARLVRRPSLPLAPPANGATAAIGRSLPLRPHVCGQRSL